MSEKIWTPTSEEKPKPIKVKATIVDAKYDAQLKCIALLVHFPNGEARSLPMYASAFSFHGRPYSEVPATEVDREMEKTAQLYRRRKGSKLNVETFENQI